MSIVSVPAFSIIPSSVRCTPVPLPTPTSTSSPPSSISSDRDILEYILDPTLQHLPPLSSSPAPYSPTSSPSAPSSLPPSLLPLVTKLQSQAIAAADADDLPLALSLLTSALSHAPQYPPALNDRAQVLLLLHRPLDALTDLDSAISLLSPPHSPSPLTLRQAHTQRGLIHRQQGREEEARADFAVAASLGSAIARQQLVAMNPYAAMCNAMLARAMQELRGEEVQGGGAQQG